jgi:cobalt-zinc-cadmium efflux system membrane fusion protein
MKNSHLIKLGGVVMAITAGLIVFTALVLRSASDQPGTPPRKAAPSNGPSEASVELAPSQLNAIKIEPAGTNAFPLEREALGTIDYDQDHAVQVFSPYAGKIINALASLGDEVRVGQPLYTIDSPDLIQAESTLIGFAATFSLASKELVRVRQLEGTNGISQRELEQAASDEQTSEGELKAARDAVRLFGKTDAEIDQITASRRIDPALVVRSPVNGRVTTRNAQPGLLVQPGATPAPYSVADLSTKWMVANVNEGDSPLLREGQRVRARIMAYPDRTFEGRISRLGVGVDPTTRRVMVRGDLVDPKDELRPGMLADFTIEVRTPIISVSIPLTGVVRNGDGTMAAWVTGDRHRFSQRLLALGLQQNGHYQVVGGLNEGELVVTDGAIFLSNLLRAPPAD